MSAKNTGFLSRLHRAAAKRRNLRRRNVLRQLNTEQLESRQLMTGAVELSAEIGLMAVPALFDETLDSSLVVEASAAPADDGGFKVPVLTAYSDESAEIMLATVTEPSPWQNQDDALDVDADGLTTPRDALLVINQLNTGTPFLAEAAEPVSLFVDVNGDRRVTPSDALELINALNEPDLALAPSGEAGGVTAAFPLVPPDTPDGKTGITYLDEPFANYAAGLNGVRYVKFHILTAEPDKVYFQDSVKYVFHYDFAKDRLAPFLNMSRADFDAVSLRLSGQQVVMGTDDPRQFAARDGVFL